VHIEKTENGADEALDKTEVLKERFVSKVHGARKDATQERTELRETGIAETKELLERYKEKAAGIKGGNGQRGGQGSRDGAPVDA